MPVRRWIALVLFSVSLIGSAPYLAAQEKESAAPARKEDEYFELMRVLADTFEQIERNYVKDVDRRTLVEAALRGMLEELDPYSNYISPDELARFNAQVEQEFGGIGVQVDLDQKHKRLMVTSPLPGTPAFKAGLKAGDLIWEIEGKSTEGMTQDQAVRIIRGKPGEPVKLGIRHADSNETEQMTIVRAMIHAPTVLGDTYNEDNTWNFMFDKEKKIGYLRVTAFSRETTRELREAITALLANGMKGLIVDLRFNPGGLLSSAIEISDLFLEEGNIVSTKGRNTPEKVVKAKKADTFPNFPMAILVNRFSASASEIVSAALQDHKRAVIVGERTWGKGSVQNVIELENGKSALKLTTASYHRPSGKNIHRFQNAKDSDEWGVMPDDGYDVKFSDEELRSERRYRALRDVLSKDGPPKSEFSDRQLSKAVDYINSQLGGEKKPDAKAENKAGDKTSLRLEFPLSSAEIRKLLALHLEPQKEPRTK